MWPIVLIFFGFILGVGTGYKVTHKKIVPFVRFVGKNEKEKVLKMHKIRLAENTKCSICGDSITIENIGVITSANGDKTFVCSKPQCITVSEMLGPISKIIRK